MSNYVAFCDKSFVIDADDVVRFRIMMQEWPVYAAEHGIEDPWTRDMKRYEIIREKHKVKMGENGKETTIEGLTTVEVPDAPAPSTWQEKCDYRFEESKFIMKRLVDKGCYDAAQKIANDSLDAFGNNQRLQDYFKTLLPCNGESGQCNIFCPQFSKENCDDCHI